MNINFDKFLSNFKNLVLGGREPRYITFLNREGVHNRGKLNYIFKIRDRIFLKKKKPVSDAYPFTLIDPFDVFGEENKFGDFNLVGDDWRDKNSEKPVALLWGFNNWKWGFISDYLPEYRAAFAPRKILPILSLVAIKRFPIKPAAFIFWGYTESFIVRMYAEINDIKIYRMEDGFIRSSSLGASHSTPYSVLLDGKGLHYNPNEVSDLEEILNNHNFSEQELSSAKECLALMQDLELSKYNPPSIKLGNADIIKIRKRVVVLGQVDNDMSIRLGNTDRWSMIELIRLAKFENPEADILYRPHPDIYKGYQKNKFRARNVEKICELTSPEIPLIKFLDTVDHAYTITSLSGLEALLRGKIVTVVGAAFYAGWGLTDDRVKFPRRKTKRTILELYSGIYLKYPRYLANIVDGDIGLQAACLKIKADFEIEKFDLYKSSQAISIENILEFIKADYWPHLLFKSKVNNNAAAVNKFINQVDFKKTLGNQPGRLFQIVYIYSLCGILKDNAARDVFISSIRGGIESDILNFLLLDLSKIYPGEYIVRQFAWLLETVNDSKSALRILKDELARCQEVTLQTISASDEKNIIDNDSAKLILSDDSHCSSSTSSTQAELLFNIFESHISMRNHDAAIDAGKKLLLFGFSPLKVILRMTRLASIKFDDDSARSIANFAQHIDLYEQNKVMTFIEARSFTDSHASSNKLNFICLLVKLITLRPDSIAAAKFMIKSNAEMGSVGKLWDIFNGTLMLGNEQSLRRASAFVAIEKPLLAIKIIENLISKGGNSDGIRVSYPQALSYTGKLDRAIEVMASARAVKKTSANYRETLRLYVLAGYYDQSLVILKDAEKFKIELGDMHPRKVYFGCRMVKQAFETFTKMRIKKTVLNYYPEKYFHYGSHALNYEKLVLLSIFGPGDEIRFSSIYNLLLGKLVQKNITISCEPRLLSIFKRSFLGINFIPVSRPRGGDKINFQNYTHVLGSDLTGVIDNEATEAINKSDHVMLVTDMLHECLPCYESFPGKCYLKHDVLLAEFFSNKLPKNKKLIGLSWRSSLTTHSRNEHYLSVEELDPIFKINGVQFVNFQYDECLEELDWIEKRYPGKVINISNIDHYNDFDSVAALMKCMDLIVSPATTIVELAGALGCPTWLLSNSSELHWRKIDQLGTDVWHSSVTHVEGAILGDKSSLVKMLHAKILDFLDNSYDIDSVCSISASNLVDLCSE